MKVSPTNNAFHRDVNEKYEIGEYEDCSICGKPVCWPWEQIGWDENDLMCHLECLERRNNDCN